MVFFFKDKQNLIYTVDASNTINQKDIQKLEWLFNANFLTGKTEIKEVEKKEYKTFKDKYNG